MGIDITDAERCVCKETRLCNTQIGEIFFDDDFGCSQGWKVAERRSLESAREVAASRSGWRITRASAVFTESKTPDRYVYVVDILVCQPRQLITVEHVGCPDLPFPMASWEKRRMDRRIRMDRNPIFRRRS